jgi:hypothetical protein
MAGFFDTASLSDIQNASKMDEVMLISSNEVD